MKKTMYKRNDIVNFFAIDKFAFLNDSGKDFPKTYPSEKHDFFELQYVSRGRRTSRIDGKDITLNEGELLIVPPNTSHMLVERSEDILCAVIGFTVIREKELLSLCSRRIEINEDDGNALMEITEEGKGCFATISGGMFGCKLVDGVSRGKVQMIKNRLEIFFIKLIESRLESLPEEDYVPRRVSVAESVLEYLKSHITDRVTLGQISDSLSLSIPYICREFKNKYGYAVMDYFLDMKIERAKQLIEESTLNFTQIAEYLAFRSEGHFSMTFSKRTGISPSEYLRSIKSSQ